MGSKIATPGADARIQGREISFDLQSAQPPINQYVGKDDQLFMFVAGAGGTPIVTVFARMMMPDGTLQQNQWTSQPVIQRGGFATPIPLPECFLLSVSLIANTISNGGLYGEMLIARGVPNLGFQHLVLCKGNLGGNLPLSWPWGVNTTNLDEAGGIRSITGTTPAAGAEISETVPAFAKWALITFFCHFVTSAAVATRNIELVITDGSNRLQRVMVLTTMAASSVLNLTFSQGGQNTSTPGLNSSCTPLPMGLKLMPGYTISTITTNLQAGDQYSTVQYGVEEWVMP